MRTNPQRGTHTVLLGSRTASDLAVWIDTTIYNPANAIDIAAPLIP